ncbi:type III PLP-dependent enzyme [Streptomyces sp. NPDC049555]|uniref:type III PLP-dependent enzyme n=1 Tax=Streptomyces sp. NPDC049555 TaxID=3154930 RepID=UPI003443EEE1
MTTPPITPRVAACAEALPDDALPAYVHDVAALAEHARAVRAALPADVELYYATKANPDPAVLRALAPHVDGYEVSSGGELLHVRRVLAGRPPLAFGGPGKTPQELRLALTEGVERLHVESERELGLLGTAATDVLLRVNLPVREGSLGGAALAMGGRPGPFGLDPAAAERCMTLLRDSPVRLRGIHAHLASGLDAPAQLAVAQQVAAWAAARLPAGELNLGGGMAVDYRHPEARFDWSAYGAGLRRLSRQYPAFTLRVEPGRALTAYCGWYVTDVLDLKRSYGEAFAVVRGGTHHLRTPVAKGHDQPFTVLPRGQGRPAVTGEPVTVVGQLCTPKDVLAARVRVERLAEGDRIAFAMAGAYAWNISHHEFLMHPRPTFHVVGAPAAG